MSVAHNQDRATRAWARSFVALNQDRQPVELAAAVSAEVARAFDLGFGGPSVEGHTSSFTDPPPGGWADPWLPGIVHEQAVSPERRTARGAWYTPRSVVEGLVRLAVPADRPLPDFIADPTCGGGAFLLAALDRLVDLGRPPVDALARVAGQDIDADAASITRQALWLWAKSHGLTVGEADLDVTVGDAIAEYPEHWPAVGTLIGNPPFASPLRAGAVPDEVTRFREDRDDLLGPYADLAAVHLAAAIERSEPGSIIAFVQPQSVLAGRDTEALRAHCVDAAPVQALWAAREAVFDAGVRACAVVLAPGAVGSPGITLAAGPEVTIGPGNDRVEPAAAGSHWAGLAATALGAPPLPDGLVRGDGGPERLGDLVTATAGFRDEYYGLLSACREWNQADVEPTNRLVTVGAVEPLTTLWAVSETKFGKKRWLRPNIDLEALPEKVRAWTERQMVPKVVVATQSRVLEPVADPEGRLIPATPLLSVHGDPDDLNLIAAVLLAPPVVAWAWRQWFGSAMAVDALKLAARQVAELPLPSDRSAWQEAAAMIAGLDGYTADVEAAWERSCDVAEVMNRAYGADVSVHQWWLDRSRRGETLGMAAHHSG